jgi:hypothetical protein
MLQHRGQLHRHSRSEYRLGPDDFATAALGNLASANLFAEKVGGCFDIRYRYPVGFFCPTVSWFLLRLASACVASILRLVYAVALIRTTDYTFTLMEDGLWT